MAKKLGLLASVPLLSTAVSCGKMNESSQTKAIVSPGVGVALLGQGYDSHREQFNAECVTSGNPQNPVVYSGEQRSEVRFQRSLSYEEMKDLLEVQVAGKFSYGAFNASGAAKFATEAASSDLSQSLIFASMARGKTALMVNPQLTDRAIDAANTLDQEIIRATCGDDFVYGVDLGSQLLINVKFEFSSVEAKSAFEASIKLSYLSLFEVEGAAQVASDYFKNNVSITITALQIGGRVQDLPEAFRNPQTGEASIIDCDLENPTACKQTLKDLIDYATDTYPKQIDDLSYEPNSPNGAAFLGYRTKSYYNGGLRQLYPNPGPVIQAEIVEARDRLAQRYQTMSNHRRRATKLLAMRLLDDERQAIVATDDILRRNIAKMIRVAETCYDTPLLCVAAEEALTLEAYDPNTLDKTLVFFDYCQIKDLSARTSKTVDAIKELLFADPEADCQDIDSDLQVEQVIELVNKGITDLRPLRRLPQLRYLDLSENSISNLTPLASLPDLEVLKVRKNNISSLSPISSLNKLRILDVAYNRIYEVEPLRNMQSLKELRIQFNKNEILDWSPIEPLNLEVFYPSLDSICKQERDWALAQGLVPAVQHRFYETAGFAPLYNAPQRRDSGIDGWVNCIALESFY
ncbi:leucine-rich repeat domain-containing protein [Pseudobacteriovorax antillogorgiicola]|nr:leucine-rich repeat domain-containing protein [Pseudobacteriovorax antillogorgiicola]